MWLPLLLMACSGDPAIEPLPYIYEDDAEQTPELDLPELEASVEGFFNVVFGISAEPIADAYFGIAGDQDAYCPPQYTDNGNTYWFGECSTESGTQYSGYAFAQEYDDFAEGEYIYQGAAIFGVFDIADTDGTTLTGGGSAQWLDATYIGSEEPHTFHQNVVSGTFLWDGADSDSWLAGEVSPDVQMSAYYRTNYDAGVLTITGGVSGRGEPANTVSVDELTMFDPSLASCGLEPAGTIGIRGADGNWFDIVFDGVAEFG